MNSVQSTFSSPRNQRIIFWVALAVLAAGIVFLVIKLVGGSDTATKSAPDKGFKPQLPAKQTDLKTASGAKVTSYDQLPAEVKTAITGFVIPGVLHNNYGPSWKYTARNITEGESQHQWATVDSRSVIPLPGYKFEGMIPKVEVATTKNIQLVLRLFPIKATGGEAVAMRIALHDYGKGASKRWLVNYWMPASNIAKVPYSGGG